MSLLSRRQSGNLPSIMQLPDEILEEIVSELDSQPTLLSFALASRAFAEVVIPRHTEYRIIRTRHPLPSVWAHLARRADLARNVREVHLCERRNYSAPDRFPTTLVEKSLDDTEANAEETMRIRNMDKALRNMTRLHTFTWVCSAHEVRPPVHRSHEDLIFSAVRSLPTLKHFGLSGRFGLHVESIQLDPDSTSYPVWNISRLDSLCFLGDGWVRPGNAIHVSRMLARSPDLEYLEMPLEYQHLATCNFPHLKWLKLTLQSGTTSSIDESRTRFLTNHPTIEHLSWFPIGAVSFPPNALPNLKTLQANRQVMDALEEGSTIKRAIECLDIHSLNAVTFTNLNALDRKCLTKLKLHTFGDITSVCHLAETFPNISWLSIPAIHLPTTAMHPVPIKLRDLLTLIPKFCNIEVFRGQALWHATNQDKDVMHKVIMGLVVLCPKLRELDHCDFYNRRDAYKRVVIFREQREGERTKIRYEVRKPPSRGCFDVMDGAFN